MVRTQVSRRVFLGSLLAAAVAGLALGCSRREPFAARTELRWRTADGRRHRKVFS